MDEKEAWAIEHEEAKRLFREQMDRNEDTSRCAYCKKPLDEGGLAGSDGICQECWKTKVEPEKEELRRKQNVNERNSIEQSD